jgi:hypothetical protein
MGTTTTIVRRWSLAVFGPLRRDWSPVVLYRRWQVVAVSHRPQVEYCCRCHPPVERLLERPVAAWERWC